MKLADSRLGGLGGIRGGPSELESHQGGFALDLYREGQTSHRQASFGISVCHQRTSRALS